MRWPRRGLFALAVVAAALCVWLAAASGRPAVARPLPLDAPAFGAAFPVNTGSTPAAPRDDRLNLNTATLNELMALPGIGEKLAQAIISAREASSFYYVEDLRAVPGIGDRRLEALKPLVKVGE